MDTKNWNDFLKHVDEKCQDTMINIALENPKKDVLNKVDYLLRDADYMMFYKDLMITELLTDNLTDEDIGVVSEITLVLLAYLNNTENSLVRRYFADLKDESDIDFISILMNRFIMSWKLREYYKRNYNVNG